MTRKEAVSLFLVAVLVVAIALATLIAKELPSGVVLEVKQESSITLKVGTVAPALSGTILASSCDGCSGGGGTGG